MHFPILSTPEMPGHKRPSPVLSPLNIRPQPFVEIVKNNFREKFHRCYQPGILHALIESFFGILVKYDKTNQECGSGCYESPADCFGNAPGRAVFNADAISVFPLVDHRCLFRFLPLQ